MDAKQIIAAKLAEWGLTLSDAELAQLVPAQENLLRWQSLLVNAELNCHFFTDADVPRLTTHYFSRATRLLVAPGSYAVPPPDDFAESRAGAAVFSGAC